MPHSGPTRVLIVDDHPIVRDGLVGRVDGAGGYEVVAAVGSFDEAVEALRDLAPDLVLVDLSLPGRGGLALLRHLRTHHPEIKALVISLYEQAVYAERALAEGASGYVKKAEASEALIEAIQKVMRGRIYVSESIAMDLLARMGGAGSDTWDSLLSTRELEVFELVGRGRRTREIADALSLSVKTVESHLSNIRGKLGFRDGADLTFQAFHWVMSRSGEEDA